MPRFVLQPVLAAILVFLASTLFPGPASAGNLSPSLYVNLQEFPLYLKRGFTRQDINTPNLHDGSWRLLSPFTSVIVSKLNLPGLPKRAFLSPFGQNEEEFTFVIPFTVNAASAKAKDGVPGLFLAGVGDNWEIYLNGTQVRSEMHLAEGSLRIQEHHSERKVAFPLPANLLREGQNLLVFRIVGDPADQTVGFQYSAPFYIADYDYIEQQRDETLDILLIGGFLIVGLYHLFLFVIRRKDVHNLYCGLFSVLMGLYYLFRTHSIYHYLPDTAVVVKLEFFCVFLVFPVLGAFAETLCSGKISKVTKCYSAVFVFFAVSQLILPRPYGSDALVVWQIMAMLALLYILIGNIFVVFVRIVVAGRKQALLVGSPVPGLRHYLTETYAGNILIALGFVLLSAIVDILDSLFFHYALNVSRYVFFIFIMTVTLMLARIYGKLNNALQAKRIFLANMSHEIRTPLNAIMGMAELITRDSTDDALREKAERIKRAGSVLTSIIDDILDFSRIEAGKMTILNREYAFRSLIKEITDTIGLKLMEKGVAFVIEIDPDIPQTLIGDSLRIRQVLLNLLWNAAKFTNQGRVEFRVVLQNTEDKNPQKDAWLNLVFTVADTGTGIKNEELGMIFTEFYQLSSHASRNAGGIGLGLSICKNLCTLMGGEIAVRSVHGRGSTFTVVLPQQLGRSETSVAENVTARQRTLLEQGDTFPSARALIVDDLASNRQVLSGLLQAYGMTLDTASSGLEALKLASAHAYDIIFMDHIMDEGMDGVATVHSLRQLRGHAATPVVALTANAMSGMRDFFLEHGFQGYIAKPIDPALLDAALARWLPKEKRVLGSERASHAKGRSVTQAAPEKRQSPQAVVNSPAPDMAGPVQAELALHRLNLLEHYRWHFENALPTDASYCHNFSVLVESLLEVLQETPGAPKALRKEAATLAEAGRRADLKNIREILPGFYTALSALYCNNAPLSMVNLPGGLPAHSQPQAPETESVRDTLFQLKATLESEDTVRIDALMARLRELPPTTLSNEERDLYFLLYDALLMGETEKARTALELWCTDLNPRE